MTREERHFFDMLAAGFERAARDCLAKSDALRMDYKGPTGIIVKDASTADSVLAARNAATFLDLAKICREREGADCKPKAQGK